MPLVAVSRLMPRGAKPRVDRRIIGAAGHDELVYSGSGQPGCSFPTWSTIWSSDIVSDEARKLGQALQERLRRGAPMGGDTAGAGSNGWPNQR